MSHRPRNVVSLSRPTCRCPVLSAKDYLHTKNQADTIISTGPRVYLLLGCEHKEDARHHKLIST